MLRVTLFQAHQRLFAGTAAQVVLPGEEGDVAVLDAHAAMLCALRRGAVQIDDTLFSVRGGLARVARNVVTILTP